MRQRALTTAITLSLLFGLFPGPTILGATSPDAPSDVVFIEAVSPYRFDGDLRSIAKTRAWQPGDPIKEVPRIRRAPRVIAPEIPGRLDELVGFQETARSSEIVTPELSFEGQGFTGVSPPDPCGDVGANYYIQAINSGDGTSVKFYNKSDGTVAAGPLTLDSLGDGRCDNGYGDPIVLYDELAQRWLLSEFSRSGNRLCVYISQTSDPVVGGWYNYEFVAEDFPDYPKYAVWHDAYYVGTNESQPAVYAFQRDSMLVGEPAAMYRSTATDLAGFGFQMLIPADADGDTPPPATEPAVFLRHRDDEGHNPGANDPTMDFLEVWEMAIDWDHSGNTSFAKVADIPMAEFDSSLCGWFAFECFPQPDTTTTLDPLREIVMHRAPYRRFDGYSSIVGNFVTDVDGQDTGGVRWFELRKVDGSGWTLAQEGTFSPDGLNRWTGAIAMDRVGNIALGHNISDEVTYPGLSLTARLRTDPAGVMTQNEILVAAGVTLSGSNRWGDYAAMAVDPVDGCTFWVTSEYGTGSRWGTWISSVSIDGCASSLFFDGFESGNTSAWSSTTP